MSKKLTASALALIALLDRAGDILVAIDTAEKYADRFVIPVIEKIDALAVPKIGPRFGGCLSRCYRAMLGLINRLGMARCPA